MRIFVTAILFSVIPLAGCSAIGTSDATLRLYEFDCGRLRVTSVERFAIGDEETDVRILSAPCYVIEHDQGRLLFDGGVPSKYAETKSWSVHGANGTGVILDQTFAEQLTIMGLEMSSFDYVAFSHLHWDHIGVANEVQGATLIVQKPEVEFGMAALIDRMPGGASIKHIDPIRKANIRALMQLENIIVDGDYDVFGDGRVRLISTPGHTPGHQALIVDLENAGPVILTGDLYHFRQNREELRVPHFNLDKKATLESMKRIELIATETDAEVWIGHEYARFQRQKHAPLYYD